MRIKVALTHRQTHLLTLDGTYMIQMEIEISDTWAEWRGKTDKWLHNVWPFVTRVYDLQTHVIHIS